MGYQVYRDPADPDRWAGYGVPAVCDWKSCSVEIDRGLGYRCEDHGSYKLFLKGREVSYDLWNTEEGADADEEWVEVEGCERHYCSEHMVKTDKHDDEHTESKPDTAEWEIHMLTDESWDTWRTENPERVAQMKERHDA